MMKCPNCQYEYKWDWIEGIHTIIKGKHKFRTLKLSNDIYPFFINKMFKNEATRISICPQCGTLFIEDIKYLVENSHEDG